MCIREDFMNDGSALVWTIGSMVQMKEETWYFYQVPARYEGADVETDKQST